MPIDYSKFNGIGDSSSSEDEGAAAPAPTKHNPWAARLQSDGKRVCDGAGCGKLATIGIHVADVASRMACDSPLFSWAKERGGSAYHSGVPGEEGQGGPGGSVPMLPPELAHGELSLNQVY